MKMKTNIIHMVEWRRNKIMKRNNRLVNIDYPYYKCKRAVGIANPNKISTNIKEVTCKNCLKWYGDKNERSKN
jgi:hypothetical protein